MAGKGQPPKDPSVRVRRNKDAAGLRLVTVAPDPQPSLTEAIGPLNPVTGEEWTLPSLALWDALGSFPTTQGLVLAQWLSLARAMMMDDAVMAGKTALASEARLRLAKYGIDPDDVARLRFQFAVADEAEGRVSERAQRQRGTRDDDEDPRLKLVQ